MTDITALVAQANARGSTSAFADTVVESKLPADVDRAKARIFHPLRLGNLSLQHRIVHPGLGRSRSDFGAESPLAVKYFAKRTTPGSLVISQATGVSADAVAWQWAASLHNDTQQAALVPVIQAVHNRGGFWFQQLFHVGRCTTPALVKLSRERAGLSAPTYGFRPVSSSAVAETGLNTHSGEVPGVPHALTIEEIKIVQDDFKKAAQRAVAAGADGIEILGGNGWLIDQFLHDNINIRTDGYGGTIENRSRFALEVVGAVAEVVGYQRIGIRISPFSYFHETDGSQPLEQILHLCHHLILRGIAYLHVGRGPVTRNLSIEQNIHRLTSRGIAREDISLRPFRRLLSSIHSTDPQSSPSVLIGNGGYDEVSGILAVEEGLADAVSFGRRFISNPDLVSRLRLGYPLTPDDPSTFYTHGAKGYTTYPTYSPKEDIVSEKLTVNPRESELNLPSSPTILQVKKRVAIVGAGVSGIASAAALGRVGGFEIRIFERRGVPGGSWVPDISSSSKPQFPGADSERLTKVNESAFSKISGATQEHVFSSPLYPNLRAKIPYKVLGGGSVFELHTQDPKNLFQTGEEISATVENKAHQFDHLIEYHTTVENCEKMPDGRLQLTLRKKNQIGTDSRTDEQFDHLVIATGHISVPRIPLIPGLDQWARGLRHSATWNSGEEFRDQKILIIGSGDSAIDLSLTSLPFVKSPIYVSERTPHPQFPNVFSRPGVEVVPTISHLTVDTIHLADGRSLVDVDIIVFATGYLHTYPFLSSKIRPLPVDGYRIPGLYQHIFDIHNPEAIAFNGVVDGALSWLTWEKSAFLIALLWSGKIYLPPKEDQEAWESRRLAETGDRKFHVLRDIADTVVYFDELNELGAEYLHTDAEDDLLLRSFDFKLVLEWLRSRVQLAKSYGIKDEVSVNGSA